MMSEYFLLVFAAAINFPMLAIVMAALYMPKGTKKTVYLLIGSEVFLLALGIVALFIAPQIFDLNIKSKFSSSFDMYLGLILLVLAVYNFFKKPSQEDKGINKNISDWKFIALGFLLTLTNINTLVLYLSSMKSLIQITDDWLWRIALLLLGNLIINLMIIIPLVINIVSPELTERILGPVNLFFQKYKKPIVSAVLIVLSFYLLFR